MPTKDTTNMDERDIPVKDGGLKITDFDDLKIAFLDLQQKHNALVSSYRDYRNDHQERDFNDRRYGI